MRKKYTNIISVSTILIIILLSTSTIIGVAVVAPAAQAATPTTGTLTITSDTVLTADHYGNITIGAEGVTLDGNGHSVIGNGTGSGVYWNNKDGITIKNLNIKNFYTGIYLEYSDGDVFVDNVVTNNRDGMWSHHLSGSIVEGNIFSNNSLNGAFFSDPGDLWQGSSGPVTIRNNLFSTNDGNGLGFAEGLGTLVINNTMTKNGYTGINLVTTSATLTGNTITYNNGGGIQVIEYGNNITGNIISNNGYGVDLGTGNTLVGNTISNNAQHGVKTEDAAIDTVYHNNFINNTVQAEVGISNPIFNLPAPIGGNYWSDYDSAAEGCSDASPVDGFCDQAYTFTGGQDDLPWTKMNGWQQPPIPPGNTYSLSFQGYDYDNKGEVSVLVNNQLVATFPSEESPQNNNLLADFSLNITEYVVPGANTITFQQNLYSSGLQGVQVTGPDGAVLLSDDTYNDLWVGGTSTASYNFNTGTTTTTTTTTTTSTSTTTTTTTTTTTSPNGAYTLSFQGYDYDNKGEVSILVNNQLATSLPTVESSQNNNIFTSFSLDISNYVVQGANTITFRQNLYSSGLQDAQVTGPSSEVVLLSDNAYHDMWTGGTSSSITYNFNTGTTSSTTTTTTTTTTTMTTTTTTTTTGGSPQYTLSFEGYDYNNRDEVSVLVNNQLVATLPPSYSADNKAVFISFTLDISQYVAQGSSTNTITFQQNLYSSGVKDMVVKNAAGATVYSNATYYDIWVGGSGNGQSVTYKFDVGTAPPPPPPPTTSYTITWDGYDYDSKQEVTVTLNGPVIGTLPSTWTSSNNDVWKSFSITTDKMQSGANTLTFTQNLYSSSIRNLVIKDSNNITVYNSAEERSLWLPSKPSTTYTFNLP